MSTPRVARCVVARSVVRRRPVLRRRLFSSVAQPATEPRFEEVEEHVEDDSPDLELSVPGPLGDYLMGLLERWPVEIREQEPFGRGLYAKRPISLGETIFEEIPVFHIDRKLVDDNPKIRFDDYAKKHYKRPDFSAEEAGTMACISNLLEPTPPNDLLHPTLEFLNPNYNSCNPTVIKEMRAHLLQTHPDQMFKLGRDKATEFVERTHKTMLGNVITSDRRSGELVGGLFPLASLLNHSCTNNVMPLPEDDGGRLMKFIAMVDIPEGDQLFHSYNPEREELRRIFGIECQPEDCPCNKNVELKTFSKTLMNIIFRGACGTQLEGKWDERVDYPCWFMDRLEIIRELHHEIEEGEIYKELDMRGTNAEKPLSKSTLKFAAQAKQRLMDPKKFGPQKKKGGWFSKLPWST